MREISKKEEGRGLRGAFIKQKGQGNGHTGLQRVGRGDMRSRAKSRRQWGMDLTVRGREWSRYWVRESSGHRRRQPSRQGRVGRRAE
jgi:hypothetical protein